MALRLDAEERRHLAVIASFPYMKSEDASRLMNDYERQANDFFADMEHNEDDGSGIDNLKRLL